MAEKPFSLGYVGVGLMGGPMTQRLVSLGWKLRTYDIVPERSTTRSAADAARGADVVLLNLPTNDAVKDPDYWVRSNNYFVVILRCMAIQPAYVIHLYKIARDPLTMRIFVYELLLLGAVYNRFRLGQPATKGLIASPSDESHEPERAVDVIRRKKRETSASNAGQRAAPALERRSVLQRGLLALLVGVAVGGRVIRRRGRRSIPS